MANSSTEITETHSESQSGVTTTQLETDINEKTYNILLIGETGVGKSTFINAFFYYMTYQSLDDALKATDITALVPTRFTVMDEDFQRKEIVYGEDENESHVPGASATQETRSYVFKMGNSMVRLLDTPGVGNTGGVDKDEKNFDRLLVTIGEFKSIHSICIMLKPNNARLTVFFQYCITQLLSRLEKSACRNIVFLFTNTRSTLYRPGDTVVPLKQILKGIAQRPPNVLIPFQKKNIFCIDNEAFRFLIANKQGICFNDDEKADFVESWNTSSKVCLSLLNYIIRLKPHKIQDTISINEARRLIVRLCKPIAQITENIDNNLELVRRQKVELSDVNKTIEELKEQMNIPIKKFIVYMDHIYTKKEKDVKIVSNIENAKSDIEKLRNTIRTLEHRELKYKFEKMVIQQYIGKFAHFLSRNAITVYNDKYVEYLDLLIRRENSSGDAAKNKKAIEHYESLKKTHEEEKKILDEVLQPQMLKAEDVIESVKTINTLEIDGIIVKDLYDIEDSIINEELTSNEKIYTLPEEKIPVLKNKLVSLFNKMY